MTITVTYDDFSGTGVNGLADYLAWFESNYYDPSHHGSSGFSTADGVGTAVTVGSTTSAYYVNDDQYAGYTLDSNDDPVAAFIAHAGEVANVYDGSGSSTLDNLAYTLSNSPSHTIFGNIADLEFGDTYTTSGGLNTMTQTHLNISGISDTANNYGLTDSNTGDSYDYDTVDAYGSGTNLTHDIIYGLMGGLGGAASTDTLEDVFDTYGITIEGTGADETFDPYDAEDIFILGGGDDVISSGFQVGSGGDVIDIDGINGFADSAAAVAAIDYSSGTDAVLTYYEGFTAHTIEISGITSGLTTDNFVV